MRLAEEQLGGPAGGEEGEIDRSRHQGLVDVQPIQQALDDPLEAPEIATGDEGQPRRLVGERTIGAGQVDVGDLEELGIGIAVRLVVPADRQQAGDQALPQGDFPLPARMVDPQRRRGRAGPDRGAERLVHQAEGHRLVQTQAGQQLADLGLDPLAESPRGARDGHRPVLGDVVIAVDPGRPPRSGRSPARGPTASSAAGR